MQLQHLLGTLSLQACACPLFIQQIPAQNNSSRIHSMFMPLSVCNCISLSFADNGACYLHAKGSQKGTGETSTSQDCFVWL